MYFIDTHAHLDHIKYAEDRDQVVAKARAAGVTKMMTMADSMPAAAAAIVLAEQYEGVYAGVGIHPLEATTFRPGDLEKLALYAGLEQVKAIGEIGLDYYYESETKELQKEIFVAQLDLARQCNLPVSIHDRDAHGDLMTILKKEGKGLRGSIHCFSGSYEMAKELIKMGWYLGVDGPVTFKNSKKLPEIIKNIPLEHLLLETDCPYLAPVPQRGKRNEPAFVPYIAEKIAEIKGVELATVAEITSKNAENLFDI